MGLAVSPETSLAEAEGVGLALPRGRRLDFTAALPLATWPLGRSDTPRGSFSRAAGCGGEKSVWTCFIATMQWCQFCCAKASFLLSQARRQKDTPPLVKGCLLYTSPS